MIYKKIVNILILSLIYQSLLLSKSNSFDKFNSNNISRYFSGIVAFQNKDNTEALNFLKSSKILINQHDPYLEKFVMSLVLDDKVAQAINIIKINNKKNSSDFFEFYILLILDSIKKNHLNKASKLIEEVPKFLIEERINYIILSSLKQYIYVFNNKKILKGSQNFGKLSLISEAFQRCYLEDKKTDSFFLKLINSTEADYSRYIYFYLTYLIENNQIVEAKI